ncbi:uncharacterized protein LOC117108689 isoform X2 [Anneissia japonica]|nr:uncharacterized protein LOC117108689 isoform X2 [Anneissia japonica]
MVKKVDNRITKRNKLFLRFKVPIFHHDHASRTWNKAKNEFETWVWVATTHDYMLYFPHNFNVLSLGTMGIITNDFWEPDGEGDLLGTWDDDCVKLEIGTRRFPLTKDDMLSFMSDVTKGKIEWDYICRQLDYDVTDILLNPNSAIPDLFYYWRFLRQFFSRRPYFGKRLAEDDFVHYNCYNKNKAGELDKKELLRSYFVISILAIILWFYSPLLIHYFPSSNPADSMYPPNLLPENFHPTYRSPVHFMKFVRCIFCFYMKKNKAMLRIRRVMFFLCSFVMLFRFYYTPHWIFVGAFVIVILVSASIPEVWSASLKNSQPTKFLDLWDYPEDVFRKNTREKEYQLLAHCMKERVFLVVNLNFWKMLYSESFKLPLFSCTWAELASDFPVGTLKLIVCVFACTVTFIGMSLLTLIYHLVPAFYFYIKIFFAIFDATKVALSTNSYIINFKLTHVLSFLCSVFLVVYIMITTIFCSYFIAEVTMFTYIGAVLDPSMAFVYVSLVGAILLVLHNLFKDLRERYEKLRDQIVDILKGEDHLRHVRKECGITHPDILQRRVESDGELKIFLNVGPNAPKVILYQDHFATYLSRPLLDFCIEQYNPVMRQIFFIVVKVLVMTFYVSIALWIKNVFHKEKEMRNIFGVAQNIAMYFVPNLLQFLAHQRHQGKKDDVAIHRCVHKAVALYIKKEHEMALRNIVLRPIPMRLRSSTR